MRVGIFFGGPSREREISFAGGRTVYDNLDKALFDPLPIFIDSHRRFIAIDWSYIYKGSIRDFYPPVDFIPDSPHGFQIYVESLKDLSEDAYTEMINKIGREVQISELNQFIDMAFLCLHGSYGEDGQLQGILEGQGIPYTGSGILGCSIGIDKAFQKKIMSQTNWDVPNYIKVSKPQWLSDPSKIIQKINNNFQKGFVIRPSNQGSSIGVSIFKDQHQGTELIDAINLAFFNISLKKEDWKTLTDVEKTDKIQTISDIRDGLGFPLYVDGDICFHPDHLLDLIQSKFELDIDVIPLVAQQSEQSIIIEDFIDGREFSCIVIRNEDGMPLALPPTEIIKKQSLYDYRSKYLPGLSRKETPIQLDTHLIEKIRLQCEKLYSFFEFQTYARIDGFIQTDGTIYLNDPNTTSGMLPSSFFFHQAAEIGLSPSQFLTYIIRTSIIERQINTIYPTKLTSLLSRLDVKMNQIRDRISSTKKVGVILGGYSFERHISVESGRNIYEKLSGSADYTPIPIFLKKDGDSHKLYNIPINYLLKDNADDISHKIDEFLKSPEENIHPVIKNIRNLGHALMDRYTFGTVNFEPALITYSDLAEIVDVVFIALHGRPGEDGTVQQYLSEYNIPFNGSGTSSSKTTINKYITLDILRKHGFKTARQFLVEKSNYNRDTPGELIADFDLPLVAKPVDDGCSSAVKIIKSEGELTHYFQAMFRDVESISTDLRKALNLTPTEEFPKKTQVLIESVIQAEGAPKFLEVTGGLYTSIEDGHITYNIFEPSEALASGEILSLEEKFLAGEGQNITPARFDSDQGNYRKIADQVKKDLERAARILNVEGYARIDAFVRVYSPDHVETIIIEVNSLPGMTPATCIFHQAALEDIKPIEFIDHILTFGFNRQANYADQID